MKRLTSNERRARLRLIRRRHRIMHRLPLRSDGGKPRPPKLDDPDDQERDKLDRVDPEIFGLTDD